MMTMNRMKGTFAAAVATALLTITLAMPLSIAPVDTSVISEGPTVDLVDVTSPTDVDDASSSPATQSERTSASVATDAARS